MDIRCSKCGEPWEIDSLHDEVTSRYPDQPWYIKDRPNEWSYPNISGEHQGLYYDQNIYDKYWKEVKSEFNSFGCEVFKVGHNAPTYNPRKNSIFSVFAEIAGDDVDFESSMIDEAEAWGLYD